MKRHHRSILWLLAGGLAHPLGGLLASLQGREAMFDLSPGVILIGSALAALSLLVPAVLQMSPDRILVRASNITASLLLLLSVSSQTACYLSLHTDAQAGLAFLSLPILLGGLSLLLIPTVYAIEKRH